MLGILEVCWMGWQMDTGPPHSMVKRLCVPCLEMFPRHTLSLKWLYLVLEVGLQVHELHFIGNQFADRTDFSPGLGR